MNCVAPWRLSTPFYYPAYPAEDERSVAVAKSLPMANRLGEIGEVVPLVAFLCGLDARWITAQTIRVNGGNGLKPERKVWGLAG